MDKPRQQCVVIVYPQRHYQYLVNSFESSKLSSCESSRNCPRQQQMGVGLSIKTLLIGNLFLKHSAKTKCLNEKCCVARRECDTGNTVRPGMSKPSDQEAGFKNKNNLECSRRNVSEIKLKRTDTTLDLSQKAKRAKEEKRRARDGQFIYPTGAASASAVAGSTAGGDVAQKSAEWSW
jgi:hypothetical protein